MIRELTGVFVTAALSIDLAAPAAAAESRYEFSNVWYVSDIDVLDGQFENYMTWLADEWVKFRKLNAPSTVMRSAIRFLPIRRQETENQTCIW